MCSATSLSGYAVCASFCLALCMDSDVSASCGDFRRCAQTESESGNIQAAAADTHAQDDSDRCLSVRSTVCRAVSRRQQPGQSRAVSIRAFAVSKCVCEVSGLVALDQHWHDAAASGATSGCDQQLSSVSGQHRNHHRAPDDAAGAGIPASGTVPSGRCLSVQREVYRAQ